MGVVLDKKIDWDSLLHYPIYDSFYLMDGSLAEELPVLRQKFVQINDQDILQISLVVLQGAPVVPLAEDTVTMFVREVLRGEDEAVMESGSISEKEVCEKYAWFFQD